VCISGPMSGVVLVGRGEGAAAREADINASPGMLSLEHLLIHLIEIDCWRGDVEQARARLERSSGMKSHEGVEYVADYRLHEALLLRAEGSARAAQEALDVTLEARFELGTSYLGVKLAFVEALECAFELGDTG